MTVYLLHFSEPLHHARHYMGYAEHLSARIKHHQDGTGARLTAAASAAGITFEIVRTWNGADRYFERHLKNQKNNPRLCPLCNPGGWDHRAILSTQPPSYPPGEDSIQENDWSENDGVSEIPF